MNNKEFKPYVPAEKVKTGTKMMVTSVIMGIILAVVFGAANAYTWPSRGYDSICFHSGSSYFHGCYPCDHEKKLHSGEQPGSDHWFCR